MHADDAKFDGFSEGNVRYKHLEMIKSLYICHILILWWWVWKFDLLVCDTSGPSHLHTNWNWISKNSMMNCIYRIHSYWNHTRFRPYPSNVESASYIRAKHWKNQKGDLRFRDWIRGCRGDALARAIGYTGMGDGSVREASWRRSTHSS